MGCAGIPRCLTLNRQSDPIHIINILYLFTVNWEYLFCRSFLLTNHVDLFAALHEAFVLVFTRATHVQAFLAQWDGEWEITIKDPPVADGDDMITLSITAYQSYQHGLCTLIRERTPILRQLCHHRSRYFSCHVPH